ncbi:hypothetical protein KQ307_07190 [Synechococcus sp. CS-1326]|uniref:DUF6339 family protein n=1 Tax=Synechococcus sp. CS-1326 TaxID=2847978 RepID=UPI00223C26E6|nr:DUF6339 family protein [Synechococcus sp. CS-1326]MCT0213276.1 hypothetical protein [Synechococcus sp. CS-1326]
MSNSLQRLQSPISEQGLVEALRNARGLPVSGFPGEVDLSLLDQTIQEVIEAGIRESALDTFLVEPLHRSLRGMEEELRTDMRIWHWLTVVRYPEIVWLRWRGSVPADPEDGFMVGNGRRPVPSVRFLGTASINGHGRNTFARLFFAAERLIGSDGNDYDLVRRLFSSQELHLGLSDREYGLLPRVNRVLTRQLADLPDQQVRAGVRNLNALGGSICLDLLDEAEIQQLVCPDPVQA